MRFTWVKRSHLVGLLALKLIINQFFPFLMVCESVGYYITKRLNFVVKILCVVILL